MSEKDKTKKHFWSFRKLLAIFGALFFSLGIFLYIKDTVLFIAIPALLIGLALSLIYLSQPSQG